MTDTATQPAADLRRARAEAREAQARAEAAYYRTVQRVIEQQSGAMASLDDAVPTRLDGVWPRGDRYVGEVREQEYGDLSALRDRAAYLEKDNWLASGVLDRSVENVVGTMIRVEPRTNNREHNKRVRKRWRKWSQSTACDVRRKFTFGGILRSFFRTVLSKGDCGLLLTFRLDERGRRQPRLQLIGPHRIESPPGSRLGTLPNGNQIADGVEMDAAGAAVAYHVRYTDRGGVVRHQRVPARDLIFVSRGCEYSEVRGETAFRGGFKLFDQIMGFLEAVVIAARVGASQAMIRKTKNPGQVLGQLKQAVTTDGRGSVVTNRNQGIQPGTINVIPSDDELVAFNPNQPQQNFPDALRAFCRILGTKFGLTLEQVLLDFSQTTYSSGKMAQNQAKVTAGIWQEELAAHVVSRVYQWWHSIEVENGEIVVPADVEDEWAHEWIPPARPSPEPLKDMQARKLALELNLDTESNMAMEDGYDFEELVEQRQRDRDLLADAGLYVAPAKQAGVTVGEDGKLVIERPAGGGEGDAMAPEQLKVVADATGIAVRAGFLTPSYEDEEHMRGMFGMPPASQAVKDAWAKEKTRAPITIQDDAAQQGAAPGAPAPAGSDETQDAQE
jgi:lambda family phage portal protein